MDGDVQNPVLSEIASLSAPAKAALMQAHTQMQPPQIQPSGPPPLVSHDSMAPQGGMPHVDAPKMLPLSASVHPPPMAPSMNPAQVTPEMKFRAAITPDLGEAPKPASGPSMAPSGGMPSMATPPPADAAPNRLLTDQQELGRKIDTGSGISQIHDKITGLMPNHSTIGNILGYGAEGIAGLGDAALKGLFPRLEAAIPGTFGHHEQDIEKGQTQVSQDEANAEKEAQTRNLDLQPQLKQAQGALAVEKQHEKETNDQGKLQGTLAQHGFAQDEENPGQLRPLKYEEMSESQQAVHDLKGAQESENDARADYLKAQKYGLPMQMNLAQQRIDGAREARATAFRRLGLSEEQFELKSKGTVNGVAPAGSMIADDGRTVGTAFQANVRPTATQRDAAGRAEVGESIRQRLLTQLADPAVRSQIGPILGRAKNAEELYGALPPELAKFGNDLKSYAAFQAGMHPVRGIGGLQYFDKVMGGLGQTPEQMEGKLQSNHETAQDVERIGKPRTTGSASGVGSAPPPAPQGAQSEVYSPDGKTLTGHIVNGKYVALKK